MNPGPKISPSTRVGCFNGRNRARITLLPASEERFLKPKWCDRKYPTYVSHQMSFLSTPSVTNLRRFWNDVKSVLQSRAIPLQENAALHSLMSHQSTRGAHCRMSNGVPQPFHETQFPYTGNHNCAKLPIPDTFLLYTYLQRLLYLA